VRDRRRFVPAPGVDIVKQLLDDITGGGEDLYHLSRSSISAVEQLADCSDPRSLVLRIQRQASKLDDSRWRMLTREFLYIAQNFGAPTRITTLAFPKFQFSFSLLPTCSQTTS
jgi:hypothetical protein